MATDKELENIVFKWFVQQLGMGSPILDPILCIELFTAKFLVFFL